EGAIPVLFSAASHGNEPITAVALLKALKHLLADKTQLPLVLGEFSLYFQLVATPDAYIHQTRLHPSGIDPNRDFPVPGQRHSWHSSNRLSATKVLTHLMSQLPFKGVIAL